MSKSMLKPIITGIALGLLVSCTSVFYTAPPTTPLKDPVAVGGPLKKRGGITTVDFTTMTSPQIHKELSLGKTEYEVLNLQTGAEITAGPATAKVGKGHYRIRSTNLRTGTYIVPDSGQTVVVAVGVIISADLVIKSGSFDLTSFNSLSGGYKRNKITGKVSIQNIGVGSPVLESEIGKSIGALDQASLSYASAITTNINHYMSDNKTDLSPHIIAESEIPAKPATPTSH